MDQPKKISLTLPPAEKIDLVIALSIAALLCAHLSTDLIGAFTGITEGFGLFPLFNFDREQNIPTLFSVTLLFAAALNLHWLHTTIEYGCIVMKRIGGLAPLVLALLAVDEFGSIHERIGGSLSHYVESSGAFAHSWLLVYVPLLLILAPVGCAWLRTLPSHLRLRLVYAGGLYLAGAVGLEMVSGLAMESSEFSIAMQSTLVFGLMTVEELLEMSGIGLLIVYLYEHCVNA